MKHAEDALQRSIVEYLRLVISARDYRVFAVPNGGARSSVEGAILKATGVLAGVPDLIIVGGGRCWFIEVKTAAGRLSRAQEAFREWMMLTGTPPVVARSLDDVKSALATWRIETRETA